MRAVLRALTPAVALLVGLVVSVPASAAQVAINMDEVVVQAQVEPVNGQTNLGGDAGVQEVQRALTAKGFTTSIDGWYGTETRSAYSGWQRSLGYDGIDANGIPGRTSLTKLGEGVFTINQLIAVGARVGYSGVTINERTRAMIIEADGKLSFGIDLVQGSYNGCSGASACTHAGGGAVDISVNGLSTTQRWQMVKALRQVGFAAWLRTPDQGFAYHIHGIAVGDTDVHVQAANQVADYFVGKNGLASHAPDNTPSAYRVPFTWWERYKRG